jgi:hypothetical protein
MNLADLLSGNQDPRERYYGGGGTTPASVAPVGGLDPTIQEQINALSEPEPVTEIPKPEHSKLWQRLLSALADGATSYAGRPGNFSERLLARDRSIGEIDALNKGAYGKSQRDAKRKRAELTLSALDRRQMKADEQKGRELLQANMLEDREQARKDAAVQAAAALAEKKAEFEAKRKQDLEMEDLRFTHDKITAGIHRKVAEGDETAKNDRKGLGPVLGTITALALTAKKNLAEGKTTPEEMAGLIDQMMDEAMLSPDARKAAEAHFKLKLGPAIRELETEQQNKDLAAGSPAPGGRPFLERLGSIGSTPQRY